MLIVISIIFTITNHPIKPAVAITEPAKPTLESAQKMLQSQNGFFTENKGQWDPSILFVGDTSFGKVAFAKDAIYYQMIKVEEKETDKSKTNSMDLTFNDPTNLERTYKSQTVKLSFVNPESPVIEGAEILTNYNNYFIGNNPKKWGTYCRNFAKVTYQDVWHGIDLAYFFTPEGMKYEYYVKPSANIQDLQIKVDGAELTNNGNSLQLSTTLGNIQDANLKVFDQKNHKPIGASFRLQNNTFSFQGISKKRNNNIVIDPIIYSTYIGGSQSDSIFAMKLDKNKNIFITGRTESQDFPTTNDSINKRKSGKYDAFLTKIDAKTNTVLYSTFFGGSFNDIALSLALDSMENIGVTGMTFSTDFPIKKSTLQTINQGNGDIFIIKLDNEGKNLLFSTFLGGRKYDCSNSICFDSQSNIFLTGYTSSIDFPVKEPVIGKKLNGASDSFLTEITSKGDKLIFSTYLGGKGDENLRTYVDLCFGEVLVDENDQVFVTGITNSPDFPVTEDAFSKTLNLDINQENAFQNFNLKEDLFICKVDPINKNLLFSSYLGGSQTEGFDYDIGYHAMNIDRDGNVVLAGRTDSSDFPITEKAYNTKNNGSKDVFVTKISNQCKLIFSTYIGGNNPDFVYDLDFDENNNIFITGTTYSSNYPHFTSLCDNKPVVQWDIFVSGISSDGGKLLYSFRFGGNSYEYSTGIRFIDQDTIVVVGSTDSTDFPLTKELVLVFNLQF